MYKAKIGIKVPSMNSIYQVNHRQRSVYMHPQVRVFKTQFKLQLPKCELDLVDKKLQLKLNFLGNWYFKNGKMRKLDLQNLEKVVIDALAERLDFGDEYIWHKVSSKVQESDWEGVELQLKVKEQLLI